MKCRRFFAAALMAALILLCAPVSAARAAVSEDHKALVLSHVAQDYPEWQVSFASHYGSGNWNGELARHVRVGLYRVEDGKLAQKTLHILLNPLLAGEEICYDEIDLVPVPLSTLTAERIEALTQEEAARALDTWIDVEKIPWMAEFMLENDEHWESLGAFSDKLIGVAVNGEGKQRICIAYWNGQAYETVLSSPAQEIHFSLNEIHSDGDELELMVDDGLVYVYCGGDSPGIDGINTECGIWNFDDGLVWDAGDGVSCESSNQLYPGVPAFPLSLTEMDLSAVPLTNSGVVAAIDAAGWACVAVNGAEMRDAPDGDAAAFCYARLFGQIKEEQGDWVLLQICGEEHGGMGWFRREDLAFGRDGLFVPCGFPSYDYRDGYTTHLNEVLQGLPAPLSEDDVYSTLAWLVGKKPNGDWLVLADTDILCTAAPDAFSDIGEPEDYYDPRYQYDWTDDDFRTLEFIMDDAGLSFLRIYMEDKEFVRDAFPQHCYLETYHDGSAILVDYYMKMPDGPLDWDTVPLENHIWMTFEFLEDKWALTDCTDAQTWMAKVENGRFTFTDYSRPGPEWEWEAFLDNDLMTFDFPGLEALIDQYNAIMPDRPFI
ncbi:MAG: hypothetical protein IKQ41_03845 [Clostridia bacterium]|nr:hypothetical protein [Clostridia bacterium]